jgi:hypothetical protein
MSFENKLISVRFNYKILVSRKLFCEMNHKFDLFSILCNTIPKYKLIRFCNSGFFTRWGPCPVFIKE